MFFFAPGDAASQQFNYGQFLGWEQGPYNGTNLLFTSARGNGYDHSTQHYTTNSVSPVYHYVINLSKSNSLTPGQATINWSGTIANANLTNNIMGGGKTNLSFTLTDVRGINTMEWYGSWQSNYPNTPGAGPAVASLDNIVITAVTGEPVLFKITSVSYNANEEVLRLVWNSEPGAIYTIENTQSLADPIGWDNLTTGIPSGGTTTTRIIDFPQSGTYYRIRKQ